MGASCCDVLVFMVGLRPRTERMGDTSCDILVSIGGTHRGTQILQGKRNG